MRFVPEFGLQARDGFLVATLLAQDPDKGQSVTFKIDVEGGGDGGDDDGGVVAQVEPRRPPPPFEINGLQLLVASRPELGSSLDYERRDHYDLTITATDNGT